MPATFNGSSAYLDNGGNAAGSEGSGDVLGTTTIAFYPNACSVSLWVKPADTAGSQMLWMHSREDSISVISGIVILADNTVRVYAGSASDSAKYHTSTATVTPDAWNHIVAIWNGTGVVLYVNGTKTTFTSTSSYVDSTSAPWRTLLGAFRTTGGASSLLNGKLAHVAVWNAVLSDANVASLATQYPSAVEAASLRSYWELDENGDDNIINSSTELPRLNLVSQPEAWIGGTQPTFSASDEPPISGAAVPPRQNPTVVSMPGDLTLQRQALLLV